MRVGQQFAAIMPCVEDYPGEPLDLVEAESVFRSQWHALVHELGGIPIGPPDSVEFVPNLNYGQSFISPDGAPVLDEAGEPVKDPCRGAMYGRGYAVRIGAN